jgi:hypothetical protein
MARLYEVDDVELDVADVVLAILQHKLWHASFPDLHLTDAFLDQYQISSETSRLTAKHEAIFPPEGMDQYQHVSIESRDDDDDLGDNKYGYGEVMPEAIVENVLRIRGVYYGLPDGAKGGNVYDIGSGSGRVLFAAEMSHFNYFKNAIGVEIVPGLHECAVENLGRYNSYNEQQRIGGEKGLNDDDKCNFHFHCTSFQSFFQSHVVPPNSLIVCHSTLFDSNLMVELEQICEGPSVPEGTWFLFVSNALTSKKGGVIETLERIEGYKMSWGVGSCIIQRKTP